MSRNRTTHPEYRSLFASSMRRRNNASPRAATARPYGATSIAALAVQIDEPLFGGAEDHRIVAPPAMRIAMRKFLLAEQRATIAQQSDDNRIGLEYGFSFVLRQAFQIPSVVVNRRVRLDAVFLSGLEVLNAMSRRRMHDAGTLI